MMDIEMARESLSLLHKLQDFEDMCVQAQASASEKGRIQLTNVLGCIAGLRMSVRVLRHEDPGPESTVKPTESHKKSGEYRRKTA